MSWQDEAVELAPTLTERELSERFGVTRQRVHQVLARRGVKAQRGIRKTEYPAELRLLASERAKAVGLLRASREFKLSKKTIASFPEYTPQPYNSDRAAEIKRMLAEGATVGQIAKATGVSRNTVYYWRNKCRSPS